MVNAVEKIDILYLSANKLGARALKKFAALFNGEAKHISHIPGDLAANSEDSKKVLLVDSPFYLEELSRYGNKLFQNYNVVYSVSDQANLGAEADRFIENEAFFQYHAAVFIHDAPLVKAHGTQFVMRQILHFRSREDLRNIFRWGGYSVQVENPVAKKIVEDFEGFSAGIHLPWNELQALRNPLDRLVPLLSDGSWVVDSVRFCSDAINTGYVIDLKLDALASSDNPLKPVLKALNVRGQAMSVVGCSGSKKIQILVTTKSEKYKENFGSGRLLVFGIKQFFSDGSAEFDQKAG